MKRVSLQHQRLHGPATEWHSSGALASTGYYRLGEPHGLFLTFDPEGQLIRKQLFRDGTLAWQGEPSDSLPDSLSQELLLESDAIDVGLRPVADTSTDIGTTDSVVTAMAGYHGYARHALRTDIAASYSLGKAFVLGNLTSSGVLADDMGPAGAKYAAALGGGIRVTRTGPFAVSLMSRLGIPLGGDNVGGFAATSLTSYSRLDTWAQAEPNSVTLQFMASGTHFKDDQLLRVTMGATPTFGIGSANPRPPSEKQLFAHFEVSAAQAFKESSVSLTLAGASKVTGQSDSPNSKFSVGIGASFEPSATWRPRVEVNVPLDKALGSAFAISFGFLIGVGVGAE